MSGLNIIWKSAESAFCNCLSYLKVRQSPRFAQPFQKTFGRNVGLERFDHDPFGNKLLIINWVFQMAEEITLKKDPKKHVDERNQV